MIREQQERVAREILGWKQHGPYGWGYEFHEYPDDAYIYLPQEDDPRWWGPLLEALMVRGWRIRPVEFVYEIECVITIPV